MSIQKEQKPYGETRINLDEQNGPNPDPGPKTDPEVVPEPQEPEITPGNPGQPGQPSPQEPDQLPQKEPNESEKVRREHEFKPQMDEVSKDET